MFSRITHCQIN